MRNSDHLKTTLPQPIRPAKLPKTAQWLSGEGAGSWFNILSTSNNRFKVIRYHPTGKIECQGIFKLDNYCILDLNIAYQFKHISHCASVCIFQNQKLFRLTRIVENN